MSAAGVFDSRRLFPFWDETSSARHRSVRIWSRNFFEIVLASAMSAACAREPVFEPGKTHHGLEAVFSLVRRWPETGELGLGFYQHWLFGGFLVFETSVYIVVMIDELPLRIRFEALRSSL